MENSLLKSILLIHNDVLTTLLWLIEEQLESSIDHAKRDLEFIDSLQEFSTLLEQLEKRVTRLETK